MALNRVSVGYTITIILPLPTSTGSWKTTDLPAPAGVTQRRPPSLSNRRRVLKKQTQYGYNIRPGPRRRLTDTGSVRQVRRCGRRSAGSSLLSSPSKTSTGGPATPAVTTRYRVQPLYIRRYTGRDSAGGTRTAPGQVLRQWSVYNTAVGQVYIYPE